MDVPAWSASALPIPQPRMLPVVGNLFDVDGDQPLQSMMPLAAKYGPIFKITILGYTMIWISSQNLVSEICDETRFSKIVHNSLLELRNLAGDGLFTAFGDEPNWGRAHRLLMPAFGPLGVRGMFGRMLDVAEQMLARWERFGDADIDLTDNTTRLTLDTLALCALDYRFNSFYRDAQHPFVAAMNGSLHEAAARERRPPFVSRAMVRTRRRYEADVRTMHSLAERLLAARRAEAAGPVRGDLLDTLLYGRDPLSGEGLSDDNIRNQLVTFLIAGHETTSGLISFAIYMLIRHPDALQKARAAVDAVLGAAAPTVDSLPKLRYVEQVLMETLRLWPTAPAFAVTPHEPTTIGDGYQVVPGDEILVLLPSLHRDTAVWGDDAEAFRPERFAPGVAEQLPPHAWKPFGNGQRACIGRAFAMQEAQLVLALVLQRFDLSFADPSYVLKVHESLTMKPEGLMIRARRRVPGAGAPRADQGVRPAAPRPLATAAQDAAGTTPLLLLYGGHSGSSEAFARMLGRQAVQHGFAAEIAPMDSHAGRLPAEGAVIVITASYEGLPPDNARQFMAWLGGLAPRSLDGVRFAVCGCGNRQWAATYQAVPTQADQGLARAGGTRLCARGEADAAGDFVGDFTAWSDDLWGALATAFGSDPPAPVGQALEVEVVASARHALLGHADLQAGTVLANRELVSQAGEAARSTRHLDIGLPAGMGYRAGDYLAVLPRNEAAAVSRALRVLGLPEDSMVVVRGATSLPADRPVSLAEMLRDYVELGQPATRRQVAELAEAARCPPDRAALLELAGAYDAQVAGRRVSLIDLLERFASARPGLGWVLSALPPARIRQYSISSSSRAATSACSITVAVLDRAALYGGARHRGVASTYLAQLAPGDGVTVAVRPGRPGFALPPPATPLIMVCAGSGIAPLRGFLQERAALRDGGVQLGQAILYFGCTHPDVDWLYRDELATWQEQGIVELRMAFSRQSAERVYVQDRLLRDRDELARLFAAGAYVFVCGRADTMVPAVNAAFTGILAHDAGEHVQALEATGRYHVDAFA